MRAPKTYREKGNQMKENNMSKLIGKIFFAFGAFFLISSIVLYQNATIKGQFGMIINIYYFLCDCAMFVVLGIFFLFSGINIYKRGMARVEHIKISGYVLIFTIVFFVSTFVFNALAHPIWQSNGRIFTYCLQIFPRLIRPSFSWDFFVPLGSVLIVIVTAIWFKLVIMQKIIRENNCEV